MPKVPKRLKLAHWFNLKSSATVFKGKLYIHLSLQLFNYKVYCLGKREKVSGNNNTDKTVWR